MANPRRGVWVRFRTLRVLEIMMWCSAAVSQQKPDYRPEPQWEQVCRRAEAQPLTAIEPAGPLEKDRLTNCDETALYYGLGQKPDYAGAFECGWFERAHPQHTVGNMFYGPGILTMLYANGKGAPQNYDLAIRFACENEWASKAEMAYRIGHLEYLRDTRAQDGSFDLCDDITSGLSAGSCSGIRTRAADAERSRKIDRIVEKLPASAQRAFPALEAAELAFEQARSEREVDLTGSARAAFQLEEKSKLRDQFLINLERFGRGDIPASSAADLAVLDRKLNDVYQRIRHSSADKWQSGTVKPEGIRDTERKWISLFDAWISFAELAYPNLPEISVRAQLIRLRLHQLRSLYRA